MLKAHIKRFLALFLLLTGGTLLFPGLANADKPTKLGIGILLSSTAEDDWDATLLRDIKTIKDQKPHGLDISIKHIDGVWGDQAGEAIKLMAKSGRYQIIWTNAAYSDQVAKLKDDFPEILFVVVGSGNKGLGDNVYWAYKRLHEPAYALGVLSGRLTKSNVIGVVGTFAAEDVNDMINAYFAGARSVNSDIKRKVAFIESWYDPAKAEQFTNAQIAAGADITFQLVSSFGTCEKANIMCLGHMVDQGANGSKSVVASTLIDWTPDWNWIIDEWWKHAAEGAPYNGNVEARWFSMADGGSALSGYNNYDAKISGDLKSEVADISAKINSGELVIPVDLSIPTSD